MKITQFISTLGFGGAESVVRDYAIELHKRGHEVTVIVLLPFLHNDNEKQLLDNGIKLRSIYEEIYWIKNTSLPLRVIRKPFRKHKIHAWLKKYLDNTIQNVLHVHLELLSFIPIGICSKLKTKLFFTCHNEVAYYFGKNCKGDFKYAKELIEQDNMQLFALHTRMKDELNSLFTVSNTAVMNNPVNIKRFLMQSKTREEMRKNLGISDSAFVVGNVGRFVKQKNHDFIIEVFNSLLKLNTTAVLVLVGDGELRKSIELKCEELKIRNKVIFTGVRTDIPDVLSTFDVFFFPSIFEGLGISLIEAQVKVPYCVTSSAVPVDTAVTNNVVFLPLSEPLDKWIDAIQNPSKYTSNAINHLEDYDIQNVISKLEGFYAK